MPQGVAGTVEISIGKAEAFSYFFCCLEGVAVALNHFFYAEAEPAVTPGDHSSPSGGIGLV